MALIETQILQILLGLVQQHQWNNILQLKTMSIFEDLLESDKTASNKVLVIKDSDILVKIVDMARMPNHRFAQSERLVRAGYMGFVVKLANLIIKTADRDKLAEQGLEFSADWQDFVTGELEQSNSTNAKSLGGRPRSNEKEEEEDTTFDVSMEKIMTRFNTFNSLMSTSSHNDEDEEEETHEDDIPYEEPAEAEEIVPTTFTPKTYVEKHIDVQVPSERELENQFTDASYWKVAGCDDDLDDLLKDFE